MDSFAQFVTTLQNQYTECWHRAPDTAPPSTTLAKLIVEQHQQNFELWHLEDKAREPDAQDATIVKVKRNIDALNQRRNDMITEIDIHLAENELAAFQDEALPWNSETIGSIVDRLSIASLKVFHMHEQTVRDDASQEHISRCHLKLERIKAQASDLQRALQIFIDDIRQGRKQNKVYRQYKMYNDPSLNPKIYGKK